jgi:putative flippase GtrA
MERAFNSALDVWHRFTFTRYLAASIIALAFDMAIFSSLVAVQMQPIYASAAGYCAGIVIHWAVSANFVFTGKARAGAHLQLQRILFAGSALVGLAITMATVWALTNMGTHAVAAKGAAVGISFIAVYILRKYGVFR